MIHGRSTVETEYTQRLCPPLDPLLLNRRAVVARADDGQVALLELADNDLPAAHHLLLVNGRDSPGEDADVGQVLEHALGLDQLRKLLRLGRLDQVLQEAVDGPRSKQLAVGDAVSRQLLDPLGGL